MIKIRGVGELAKPMLKFSQQGGVDEKEQKLPVTIINELEDLYGTTACTFSNCNCNYNGI